MQQLNNLDQGDGFLSLGAMDAVHPTAVGAKLASAAPPQAPATNEAGTAPCLRAEPPMALNAGGPMPPPLGLPPLMKKDQALAGLWILLDKAGPPQHLLDEAVAPREHRNGATLKAGMSTDCRQPLMTSKPFA